ncbi:hypothetical protein CDD81_154 [Ophiocordyceps australis]|uniref:HMG box domain-containing protein n=1 Tax=Ophiocordyceps australis TaxID=1399860 RepID=A0A2C5YJW8_9HYPO|nr:hypothetical protein CDD81_154 [Ophiocordyceps australis]
MPRPKKVVDDKAKVPAVTAPVPAMATMVPPPSSTAVVPVQQQQPMPIAPPPGAAPTAPAPVTASRLVDSESFLRVRDSAVGRLNTIGELLRSFTADYLRQTNLLLGEPGPEGTHAELLQPFSHFENAAAQLMLPTTDVGGGLPVEKKERKKRAHDPNAPKRPLTPYFLYMQYARTIISNDLGQDVPKGAVQEEGQRRWANMDAKEKQAWNGAYQYNLSLYNARTHAYKAGNPLAKDMTDDEATEYAQRHGLGTAADSEKLGLEGAANVNEAIAEQLEEQPQPQVPVPPQGVDGDSKTPKKSSGRKRKTGTPAIEAVEQEATPASPDKKRRRASTKAADAPAKEESKKSSRKKQKATS